MNDLTYKGFALDGETALALLQWQAEMGADEPCLDDPIDRIAEAREAEASRTAARPAVASGLPLGGQQPAPARPAAMVEVDHIAKARQLAEAAGTIEALADAMRGFDGLDLHKGARNFCFADGNPKARVMIVGEAPGEQEDLRGLPFVGPAGKLLDQMFAAIGLTRDAADAEHALYISNTLPWRPPGNRSPEPHEIEVMQPFLQRHIELADPDVLVLLGNTPCQAVIGKSGILRLRGTWHEAFGRPVLPMTHPAYLLRMATAKRDAWADLLSLATKLDATPRV